LIVTAPVAASVAVGDLVTVPDLVATAVAAMPAVEAGWAIPDLTARGGSDLARS
jgi:predicted RecA/RadA family phage recombinase